jgi:hypothetical protein
MTPLDSSTMAGYLTKKSGEETSNRNMPAVLVGDLELDALDAELHANEHRDTE